ncbi:sce7726 family protein [Hydrogenovibrio sp. JE_KL2]|uniref:sce7726 family protein n=1 Tax=Hydrogenovibrio sp. JE_KL2 TaxID=2651188 RepID=UPI00128D3531|nr:sce7726 family protein [Hydrogenovibrio sp. JE_KL2]MPQ76821.1 sce7726 family protein [Hydrogenovibrio sp. JE_KL2]
MKIQLNSMRHTESTIKLHLIEWLEENGYLNDAVVINELPVADRSRTSFARRIDIAVANGKLLGFEIKSEYDSLDRLEGQLKLYHKRFDKVFVVCAPKFTSKVLEIASPSTSVIEFENDGQKLRFKVAQKGKITLKKSANDLLSFVNQKEILSKLKQKKVNVKNSLSRSELYELCSNVLSIKDIRTLSIETLKQNYRSRHNAFMKSIKNNGYKPSCLHHLSASSSKTQDNTLTNAKKEDDMFIANILAQSTQNKMRPIKRTPNFK